MGREYTADEVDFGALAAEREKGRLGAVFVPSKSFERIAGGGKIIILGNRGAGKTALLQTLADRERRRGGVVVELAPEDFAYEFLSAATMPEEAGSWSKQGAYAAAWKYLLYLLAMKHAVKALPGLKTGAAKRIHTYLRDHHENVEVNPLGSLISYLKRLEGVKVGGLEASLKARELHRLYRLEEIDALLDDLNDLASSKPVHILVDELDRGWDGSPEAIGFVAGLFNAGTSISQRTPNVRVIMSLRRELYDNIPALYDDAQKVRDTIEIIEWDRAHLLSLICRRIALSLGTAMTDEESWAAVFPPSVRGRPSFDYVTNLTLLRPRELIQLCSQIQDLASDSRLPFSGETIIQAERVYSRDRFNDIVAEYRFQYPGLETVLETFRGCDRFLRRSELELACLELSVGDRRVGRSAIWVEGADPEAIIEVLWRVGFLLAERGSDEGGASDLAGIHEARTLNLSNVHRFAIHDMFANYLDCR
jgi:hypothetical protein